MSWGIIYESKYSREKPIVFVDAEEYGSSGSYDEDSEEYNRCYDDHDFSNTTAKKNLDLQIILRKLESYIEDSPYKFKFHNPEGIIEDYFIPTQDINELRRRQEVVKEIYENHELRAQVCTIILSARNLNIWTPNFSKRSAGNFAKRTEQIHNLVSMVESSLALDAKSETLLGIKEFAQTIAEKREYEELKSYIKKGSENLFKKYHDTIKVLKDIWDFSGIENYQSLELVDLLAEISKKRNYSKLVNEFDANSRRDIYSALCDLRDTYYKLTHDKELEHIVDAKESETFKIEERLEEAIEKLGSTAILNFKKKHEITESQKFFVKQFSKLLYHIEGLIDDGLKKRMEALCVRTNGMEKELVFYYSLVRLAQDMEKLSPVTMPEMLDKEKRYCKIKGGNVPSFIIRDLDIPRYHRKNNLVANDVLSNKKHHIFVITGANDNGKTTYERMIGQIQTLAQIGSYVPAVEVKSSIVDGIFSSFNEKDKPGEKEGSFKSGLSYLDFITVPQERSWRHQRTLDPKEIKLRYDMCDHSFITPYSLVLLDEIAIGSDSEATDKAITTILNAAIQTGSTLYLSTHYHPIAVKVEDGKFPHTMNLGVKIKKSKGKMIETYKILRNRHEPSDGKRLFKKVGYTEERIKESYHKLVEARIIPNKV